MAAQYYLVYLCAPCLAAYKSVCETLSSCHAVAARARSGARFGTWKSDEEISCCVAFGLCTGWCSHDYARTDASDPGGAMEANRPAAGNAIRGPVLRWLCRSDCIHHAHSPDLYTSHCARWTVADRCGDRVRSMAFCVGSCWRNRVVRFWHWFGDTLHFNWRVRSLSDTARTRNEPAEFLLGHGSNPRAWNDSAACTAQFARTARNASDG